MANVYYRQAHTQVRFEPGLLLHDVRLVPFHLSLFSSQLLFGQLVKDVKRCPKDVVKDMGILVDCSKDVIH